MPCAKHGYESIATLPNRLEATLVGITEAQLETPYRPGGWTVRQVVHHLADSHINAYCRLHLALTEDAPTIKPYLEAKWAQLPDSQLPVDSSLEILRGVHFQVGTPAPQYGRGGFPADLCPSSIRNRVFNGHHDGALFFGMGSIIWRMSR